MIDTFPDLLRHRDGRIHVGGTLRHPAGIEQLALVPEHIPEEAGEGEIQRRFAGEQEPFGEAKMPAEACPHVVCQPALVFQTDGAEALPAADQLLHAFPVLLRQHIVCAAVVHVDIGAAEETDQHGTVHLVMDKQFGQEVEDQILRQHKPEPLPRQGHQAAEGALAAGDNAHPLPAVFRGQLGNGVDALIFQEGEGLFPSDDLGGQQGQDAGSEVFFQEGLGFVRQAPHPAQFHAIAGQFSHQFLIHPVLLRQQGPRTFQDGGDLLLAGHAGLVVHSLGGVQQEPYADHVKFVQIALKDGGETQTFQQGIGGILGLLQDTLVGLQPGQLTVGVTGGGGGLGLFTALFHTRHTSFCGGKSLVSGCAGRAQAEIPGKNRRYKKYSILF